MGVDLGKPAPGGAAGPGRGPDEGPAHVPELVRRPLAAPAAAPQVRLVTPREIEPRLGGDLPVLGFVPDPVFQLVRFVGLGAWILLYATLPWGVGFLAMWTWIALNVAYENEARRRRRLRRHYKRALRQGLVAPVAPAPFVPAAEESTDPLPPAPPATAPLHRTPEVTAAEKALVATVRRVDTSDRFDRTDVILVHEVADLLGPLLLRIADPRTGGTGARGGDAQVRHDLETLAGQHLPRTIADYLALPDDVVHGSRNASGLTPAQELRSQLHLLVEGCRQLREAVLAADVDRQQQQSRFLEAKFRRSDLDL